MRRVLSAVLFLALVAGAVYWWSRPRIVFLGFPDMYRFVLADAAAKTGVRYDYWSQSRIDDPNLASANFRGYGVIYVSARRSDPLTPAIQQAIADAESAGSRVIVIPPHHTGRLGVGIKNLEGKQEWLGEYWRYGGPQNTERFLQTTATLFLGKSFPVEPPVPTPDDGYYHPDAPDVFSSTKDYLAWQKTGGRWNDGAPKVLIDFADGWKLGMNRATDTLIRAFEARGVNVGAIFGVAQAGPFAAEFQPDLIVSRKHGRWWLAESGVELLDTKIDVPVVRGLSLLFTGETFGEYRKTRNGIRGAGLVMGATVPELDGSISPTLIEGLDAEWYGRRFEAVEQERIGRLVDRSLRWIELRRKPNPEKRIAVVYVAGIGKGRITAASLNVPESLTGFLHAMGGEGYSFSRVPVDADQLLDEMLTKGRNISPTQTGELYELAAMPGVEVLPTGGYIEWFRSLPENMQQEVEQTFGPPPGDLMTIERDGKSYFVVPKLDYGNVIVLPQPLRGAKMDSRLQHNDRVPPPHQYLAVYWWLREVWKADAIVNYGTHGTHEFLPGRPLGQLADDWSDRVLGPLPNIYVYVMDNVGEALIAKRRGSAVTVSHQIPPIAAASLSEEDKAIGALYRATEQFLAQDDGALKGRLRAQIREQAHQKSFDRDLGFDWTNEPPSDEQVGELQLHIHLINEDKIPLGLHVHGRPSAPKDVASLITQILGKPYIGRVAETEFGFRGDRGELYERAKARAIELVTKFLEGAPPHAAVVPDQQRVLRLKEAFALTKQEIPRTLRAMRGGYVPPGGGGDPVRNPQALPTGRNLYGINPGEVPTRAAWDIGVHLAEDLLAREQERLGRSPRKVGFTLWNTEVIRQNGTDLAQILYLMGARPLWDHNNIVSEVELIPASELGRPRVDVVIQAASLFRDTFPDRMELLDKAARLVIEQGDGENYLAEHTGKLEEELKQAGLSAHDARLYAAARVFGNSIGGYGTGLVAGIERSGSYDDTKTLTSDYVARLGSVYTAGAAWGANVPGVYEKALRGTDAVALSRSTNVVSPLTLDHYFEYLGGMTMAVRDLDGESPETYIADVRDVDHPAMETLGETLTRDLRGKFWNPRWIREQQAEGFSGAVEITQTATNLFGWQVTKPEAVSEYVWDEVQRVYVGDALSLDLPEWFARENPYAFQNLTAILLESARKGFWHPGADVLRNTANAYARSVSLHGPAGDIRTTDNFRLQSFVGEQLRAPGNQEGIELTSLYDNALAKSAGAAPASRIVAGRKLVREPEAKPPARPAEYSTVTALALLIGVAVFVIGLRRNRDRK
ncbi:MAG: cobaltochelatase subunit CobN [Bryobacterales bacterium]